MLNAYSLPTDCFGRSYDDANCHATSRTCCQHTANGCSATGLYQSTGSASGESTTQNTFRVGEIIFLYLFFIICIKKLFFPIGSADDHAGDDTVPEAAAGRDAKTRKGVTETVTTSAAALSSTCTFTFTLTLTQTPKPPPGRKNHPSDPQKSPRDSSKAQQARGTSTILTSACVFFNVMFTLQIFTVH